MLLISEVPPRGHYADVALHAGFICLTGTAGMDVEVQLELIAQVLDELATDSDLVNQVLEITLEDNRELHILRYKLPPEED